jgi:hypothetical protein
MKTGRLLTDLAQEIQRQAQSKADFIANQPGLDAFKTIATDIAYLYDVAWKGNRLHVIA